MLILFIEVSFLILAIVVILVIVASYSHFLEDWFVFFYHFQLLERLNPNDAQFLDLVEELVDAIEEECPLVELLGAS